MKCPYCIKICKKCNKILIANSMNFHKKKNGKYGLRAECKECYNEYSAKYYQDNKEVINKRTSEYNKLYYQNNKEKFKEYNEQYYQSNKEEVKENRRKYYENNKETCKETTKQWCINNPDKVFNICQKRRLKEQSQGNGISKEQWLEIMTFFNWKCAYSGENLTENNRSLDHIIPLNRGGENEIWNLVPMLKNYNSQKYTNDMLEWYILQPFYSEERLNKIYEWVKYAEEKYKKIN